MSVERRVDLTASDAVPFGDRALLVRTGDVASAHALAARVTDARDAGRAPLGVDEVVVGFASVLVVLDPGDDTTGLQEGEAWVDELARTAGSGAVAFPAAVHEIPVVFDGADREEAAALAGVEPARLVELLVGVDLEVAFIGFAPGFPYLTGLPPELAALPRRVTPRTSVPAGSVAVAGGFASVYPRATPGGWHLLGRTSVSLFDPVRPPHSRVAPGDRIRFTVAAPGSGSDVSGSDVSGSAVPRDTTTPSRPLLAATGRCLEVLDPGLRSTVQDAGRTGAAALGVPRAGAADPEALSLVNLLLGNPPSAAVVECTATGPTVRMVGAGHIAVVGAGPSAVDVHIDGHPVPDGTVVPVDDGQIVSVGPVRRGLRAYLGVAGGLETPVLFGSRSSDLLSGLGPGPLLIGDRLARGAPSRARGHLDHPPRRTGADRRSGTVTLRVLPGPDGGGAGSGRVAGGSGSVERLATATWRVADDVDRIGVRLLPADGTAAPGPPPGRSTPMVTGAIQLPPDGNPIVLLVDHATVGGYPVVACVISADLPRLGQLRPGDTVVLAFVDHVTATRARVAAAHDVATAVSGWFPTTAGT